MIVNIGLALTAAAMLPVLWILTREVEPEPYHGRTLTTVTLTWLCDVGHTFQAAGQIGPRKCWSCNRPAYPMARYVCPVHGVFEAQVLLTEGEHGVTQPEMLRLVNSTWVAPEAFVCPRCGRVLEYAPKDPLDEISGTRRRGG